MVRKKKLYKKINTSLIYDLIYRNLNYVSQIKLKKSISDMKDELKKIQNMNSDDIDYKKLIVSMANMPSNVKVLALEKVEEKDRFGKKLLVCFVLVVYLKFSQTNKTLGVPHLTKVLEIN